MQEYLIYVRAPVAAKYDADKMKAFLDHVAQVLSDKEEGVYVESYFEYDGEEKARPREKPNPDDEVPGGKGNGVSMVGTEKSSLEPMYLCHGKF
jgi:hypothetical protein